MGTKVVLPIPVTGPLDTANPTTNRPPGTFLETIDVAHRWLGPRRGGKNFTWPGRLPSGASPPGNFPGFAFDGTNTYVVGTPPREQADLGIKWTADLCFQATDAVVTSGAVPIFQWGSPTVDFISIGIYGSTHATQANKIHAIVKTTDGAGTVATTFTLVAAAPIFSSALVSSGAIVRVLVRLIRDGSTLTLKTSRAADQTATGLSDAEPHVVLASGRTGVWYFADDQNLGTNSYAAIRPYAVPTAAPLQAIESSAARGSAFKFYAGTYLTGNQHAYDHSMYGSHGSVSNGATALISGDFHYPCAKTSQGFGSFVTNKGGRYGVCTIGGRTLIVKSA